MIKFIVYLSKAIVTLIAALLWGSCQYHIDLTDTIKGSGNVIQVERTLNEEIQSIEVKRGMTVVIEQTPSNTIRIEADDNLIEYIETEITHGNLVVTTTKNTRTKNPKIVKIGVKNLNAIRTSSGSEVKNIGTLLTQEIDLRSSSGSHIKLVVESEKITCDSSSGSEIELEGKALVLECESSSGSTITAKKMKTNQITAKSSSGSSISLYPIQSLDATSTSGSTIKYYNSPNKTTKKSTSGGSVKEAYF
ncbi:head GIN domain-containing protein [Flavobacterium sp.]|uniref:head GIN domain-containing protein n=1 Tax=Flavobacterium sp. TaxID=239 RepID=UPI002FD8B7DA